jgi:hypothetical protein
VSAAMMRNARTVAWMLDCGHTTVTHELVRVSLASGCVPLLELLRARGVVFGQQHLPKPVVYGPCFPASTVEWLVEVVEDAGPAEWSRVFWQAASYGAPLTLLLRLHEHRGAAVNLKEMACGGCSVQALEWALLVAGGASQDVSIEWHRT